MTDFSTYKFRCSSLGSLMTEPRSKAEILSETTKAELIKVYIETVYGRRKDISNKYVEKGLQCEEDGIDLLAKVKERMFKKNEERRSNDYITGEADIVKPLIDIKNCWDLHTFFAAKTKPLKKDYEYQILGYCELYDEPKGTVAHVLIDTPIEFINDEKRRLFYKGSYISQESPDYLEACEAIGKEMTFNDIPLKERLHEVTVERNTALMEKVYERVVLCREWLNEFAKQNQPELCNI